MKKGQIMSLEQRLKIGAANRGKKRTEAMKQTYSLIQKGRHNSPGTEFHQGEKSQNWNGFKPGSVPHAPVAGKLGAAKRWEGHVKQDLTVLRRFHVQRRRSRRAHAAGSHTLRQWETLKRMYKYMCLCCKRQEPEVKLTQDHIVPLSKGGTDYIWNIQPLCKSCNSRKSIRTISFNYVSLADYENVAN